METIAEYLKIKHIGKDGDMEVYSIGCTALSKLDFSMILEYCRDNNIYFVLDLVNRRILTKNK